jgi:hypothetical protein
VNPVDARIKQPECEADRSFQYSETNHINIALTNVIFIWRYPVQISVPLPAFLTEIFPGCLQYLQANARKNAIFFQIVIYAA